MTYALAVVLAALLAVAVASPASPPPSPLWIECSGKLAAMAPCVAGATEKTPPSAACCDAYISASNETRCICYLVAQPDVLGPNFSASTFSSCGGASVHQTCIGFSGMPPPLEASNGTDLAGNSSSTSGGGGGGGVPIDENIPCSNSTSPPEKPPPKPSKAMMRPVPGGCTSTGVIMGAATVLFWLC